MRRVVDYPVRRASLGGGLSVLVSIAVRVVLPRTPRCATEALVRRWRRRATVGPAHCAKFGRRRPPGREHRAAGRLVLATPVLDRVVCRVVDEVDRHLERHPGPGARRSACGAAGSDRKRMNRPRPQAIHRRRCARRGSGQWFHPPHRQRHRERQSEQGTLEEVEEDHPEHGDEMRRCRRCGGPSRYG